MSDDNILEELLKLDKNSEDNSNDELAILKVDQKEDEISENSSSKDREELGLDEIIKDVSEDAESDIKLFLGDEERIVNGVDKKIINDASLDRPLEIKMEGDDLDESFLDDFFKIDDKQEIPSDVQVNTNNNNSENNVKKEEDYDMRKIGNALKIKNLIDSFLDLLINKNGKSLHITSDGSLFFILRDGSVEKEKNTDFYFKSLYSFADYIIPKTDFEAFSNKNAYETRYVFGKKEFNLYFIQNNENFSVLFDVIYDHTKVFENVIDKIPVASLNDINRGTINIISGFNKDYSEEFIKTFLEKNSKNLTNVICIHENKSFEIESSKFNFIGIKIHRLNRDAVKSLLEKFDSNIIMDADLTLENIELAIDLAFSGRNIYILTGNKNTSRDITEYCLSKLENRFKRRVFINYLNSIISINILVKDAVKFLPVFDFILFDKKIKRHLVEEKFDAFYRELADDTKDNIISFEKIIKFYLKNNILTQKEADSFSKSFSWIFE